MKSSACLLFLLGLALALSAPTQAQTTWTSRHDVAGISETLWSVTDGNAGIVAVGTGGKILHSYDAKTWTPRASGFTGWLVAVTYGSGRYIAVGEGGTILTSTDALAWTAAASTGTTARLNNVLYSGRKFVAVGEGGAIVVSTDGNVWSATTSGVTGWLHGLASSSGMWIATGQAGTATISSDGFVWAKQTTNTVQDLEAVVAVATRTNSYASYNESYIDFLGVGGNGVSLYMTARRVSYPASPANNSFNLYSSYSPSNYDPVTKTYVSGTGTTARLRSLTNVNSVFVATGENGTVRSSRSPYGPWSAVTTGTTKNLVAASPVQGTLMLVGESETVLQSEQIFTSRLGNISTRGLAQTGDKIIVAGTIVQGTLPKQILIRGVGPALANYGVTGVLADPTLSVFDQGGRLIATNTGWSTNPNAAAIATTASAVGAFALPANSKDSALLLTLSPGSYTFQLKSASGLSGNALIEAYDFDAITATSSRAINISSRGPVGTGDSIMIAGLIVQGQSSRTLLIRGIGPTLAGFGVTDTLADPVIKVLAGDGTVLATNDNWGDDTTLNGRTITADDIRATAVATGAFALTEASKDASLLITLVPGSYTVQVSGKNGTTGVAIVEAYDVP